MPIFKYVANKSHMKYGIKIRPAVLEILKNSIIFNTTNISKSIIRAKASPMFFMPKNAGLQDKLTKSCVKNNT